MTLWKSNRRLGDPFNISYTNFVVQEVDFDEKFATNRPSQAEISRNRMQIAVQQFVKIKESHLAFIWLTDQRQARVASTTFINSDKKFAPQLVKTPLGALKRKMTCLIKASAISLEEACDNGMTKILSDVLLGVSVIAMD
uniref:Uncharacterized protein n=1 Tax=Vespula pensylvanica TaxID=30213 RepID=A0A834JPX6_VESPE|nr:hypothetical protein H0235_017450 [Vespula pensylvanica]